MIEIKALDQCSAFDYLQFFDASFDDGRIHGYLAYENGTPIGWCNAGDKNSYAFLGRLVECRSSSAAKIKSIVCIHVGADYREQGVASALIRRVCADAKSGGYDAVESYPNAHMLGDKEYGKFLNLYKKHGFETMHKEEHRQVMRKIL